MVRALRHVWGMTTMFYTSMGQILTAKRPVDELGGPIRIAKRPAKPRMPAGSASCSW
jgi:regulator of sigma E protease